MFNVSTGEGQTIHDLFLAVSNYLGIAPPDMPVVPPGPDDVPQVLLDPSATEQAFGWSAKINFEDTIANQLCWYDHYGINDIFEQMLAVVFPNSADLFGNGDAASKIVQPISFQK